MSVASSWLTAVRLRRMEQILNGFPRPLESMSLDALVRLSWVYCGGPIAEVHILLELLEELGLVALQPLPRRTRTGHAVASATSRRDRRSLALAMIRKSWFWDQAERLLELSAIDSAGWLVCPARVAREQASQLTGVLQWWPDVEIATDLHVPPTVVAELSTVWSLRPPALALPDWVSDRKRVGDRAEMYTVQWERDRVGDPTAIAWVSRVSDSLGWDVEDHSIDPYRRIEAKGSRQSDRMFHMSTNEWSKAHELGPLYDVYFWAEINLNEDPTIEYVRLLRGGYPIVVPDLAKAVAEGRWTATPDSWRLEQAGSSTEVPPAS